MHHGFHEPDENDVRYWQHAQAAVSEGLCPDCTGTLSADRKCDPCTTEWIRFTGQDRWIRFEQTEATLQRLGLIGQ